MPATWFRSLLVSAALAHFSGGALAAQPQLFATILINRNEEIDLKCKEYARMYGKPADAYVYGEKVEDVGPAIRVKCYIVGDRRGDAGSPAPSRTDLPNGTGAWRNLDTLGTRVESRSVGGYDQPFALENRCRQVAGSIPRAIAYRVNLDACVATPTSQGDYIQCRLRSCDFQVVL